MPAISFRSKLMLAMAVVVIGGTGAILSTAQHIVQTVQQRSFERLFQLQMEHVQELQRARLQSSIDKCSVFAKSVRLRQLMRRYLTATESDANDIPEAAELLYRTAEDELRDILYVAPAASSNETLHRAAFFRFLDDDGAVIEPPKGLDTGLIHIAGRDYLRSALANLSQSMAEEDAAEIGYLVPPLRNGSARLVEVVTSKIIDVRTGERVGALVIGFPVPEQTAGLSRLDGSLPSTVHNGILLSGKIYCTGLSEQAMQHLISPVMVRVKEKGGTSGSFQEQIEGTLYRAFFAPLPASKHFPAAYQLSLYSLGEAIQQQQTVRWRIAGFGLLALLSALLLSALLSHGLTVPIRGLVAGTREVQEGNYQVTVPVRSRDEIGELTSSFNAMTQGLALKEKYRHILNMVADKAVAQELVAGKIALGGEHREASVLFCDIRGFTALTQNMDPVEVIHMLNEHMGLLAPVVCTYHGVVDKYVGDLIMALFGAPKSYSDDAYHAVKCAHDMILRRRELNATSKYKIEMGIGIASGRVVAGGMGSADRLSYTVLGERVNLAARLCSKAGRMEVVIDQTTYNAVKDKVRVEALPELELKGFSSRVPAYKILDVLTK